jgi:Putative endonuclease segE, GIY-YIG domain
MFHIFTKILIMWLFNKKKITKIPDTKAVGFVYIITNLDNNKIYVGKKNFLSVRKTKLGKKVIKEQTDKRKSKYKINITEMDWQNYVGSNIDLKADIAAGHKIKKEIICLAYSKQSLTYLETKYQFAYNVLEINSYNGNILGKFFRKTVEKG